MLKQRWLILWVLPVSAQQGGVQLQQTISWNQKGLKMIVLTQKQMISTSAQHAEHTFAGRNTQHSGPSNFRPDALPLS